MKAGAVRAAWRADLAPFGLEAERPLDLALELPLLARPRAPARAPARPRYAEADVLITRALRGMPTGIGSDGRLSNAHLLCARS